MSRGLAVFLCSVLLFVSHLAAQSGTVRYIYDELGRLVGVVDGAGDSATYHYDAVGNLTSITRAIATDVTIIEFTPNGGGVGQTVSIYGTGFSATPASNTVSFNGTAATVTSSTANSIVTSVPSGATTGTISITSPNGTANSGTSFVVGRHPLRVFLAFPLRSEPLARPSPSAEAISRQAWLTTGWRSTSAARTSRLPLRRVST